MLEKINKYKDYLNCNLAKLAGVLDPSIANPAHEVARMKSVIRGILSRYYGYCEDEPADDDRADAASKRSSLLKMANLMRCSSSEIGASHASVSKDEVDRFFEFTKEIDDTCSDVIDWWASIGRKRFPAIALLARDTLMCMGSSVPSESSFSDSGGFVPGDRSRLTDVNIEMMMKLRSWNRLYRAMK